MVQNHNMEQEKGEADGFLFNIMAYYNDNIM